MAGASLATTSLRGQGFVWLQSSAPTASWQAVASSADGRKLAAVVQYGGIYTSTNAGGTWKQTSAPSTSSWQAVASSADGTNLVALVLHGGIYCSTNAGLAWTASSAPTTNWEAVASSADGINLVAAVYAGGIYCSTNAGFTWRQTSAPTMNWQSVASSADGSTLAAAVYAGGVYCSTNAGLAWTLTSAPATSWQSITSSADGSRLAAAAYNVGIYTSTNSGLTWRTTSTAAQGWASITASADGSRLAAGAYGGGLYTSTNSGVTWTSAGAPTANWLSVASAADGTILAAAAYGSRLWTAVTPCWIAQQPESTLACPGGSHTFQVTAGGTPPLGLQWRKSQAYLTDAGNVSGTATSSLTLRNLSPSDTANYDVVVTNAYGGLTSAVATLTVTLMPARATPIILNGFVTGATLLDGGCGYSSPPVVIISGTGGSGAAGYAETSNGTVTNIAITSTGYGYPTNATLFIALPVYPVLQIKQGLFSPAPATADPVIASGHVVGAVVTSGGSGYTEPPTVSISDATGHGAGAYARVSAGSVVSIVLTNAGSGYSANTLVTISAPPGISAIRLTGSNLLAGQIYQLRVAEELSQWTNYGQAFVATNASWAPTNNWNLVFTNGAFFRLQMLQ
jgi:hypothetical protein